ncbi:DNA-binding response regulator [Dokdonia sinensis]|uniref:DNA-binding response regulator n=1 Tax=Dokdonia sinensis TaxID=2479847 RepID=A0A3M0FTR8_9FLAO|nr:response regulator [Dokdonia sinensis]RMB56051.1 DNA-binding response regulator [Dokdonia sinensis]
MSKVRILVVEDEILIADNICDHLEELGYEPLEPVSNYTGAIEALEAEHPDIAILDIQLAGKKTGIDVARIIRDKYNIPFIFLTSNSDEQTVSEAKETYPPAFLVKPFSKAELYTSIEIALYNFSGLQGSSDNKDFIIKDAVFFKEKGSFLKLLFKDIEYIKSAHVYVEIYLKSNKMHVVRTSLNDILDKLSSDFIRVHRGYIINTQFLQRIETTSLTIGNTTIPVGVKYREGLLSRINHF